MEKTIFNAIYGKGGLFDQVFADGLPLSAIGRLVLNKEGTHYEAELECPGYSKEDIKVIRKGNGIYITASNEARGKADALLPVNDNLMIVKEATFTLVNGILTVLVPVNVKPEETFTVQ